MVDKPIPDFDSSTPVLIFKTGKSPFHHGTLGIIRSLGSVGVPVYAILEDRFVPAGFSHFLTGKFIWNPDENETEGILDGLRIIGERIGRPAVIVPTNDHAAIFIEEHSALMSKWYRFPRVTPGLARALADKRRLHEICQKMGLPSPNSIIPTSFAETEALAASLEFPLLVKIAEPWQRPLPNGLSSTSLVSNRAQLLDIFRLAEGPKGLPLLIQEHIPSSGDADAMFAGYCDDQSRCLISLTGEKLRSYPPHAGMTSASRTSNNEELRSIAENFLARIAYRGIMDLEFRQDLRDGKYKLLDFNPRIGAQFRLYESAAGIDVVRAMHLDLTGRLVPQSRQFKKRSFIVENYELRVLPVYCRDHGMTLRQWLHSLEGSRELAWFSRNDLLPCVAMWLRLVSSYIWRRLRPQRHVPSRARNAPAFYFSRRGQAPSKARQR